VGLERLVMDRMRGAGVNVARWSSCRCCGSEDRELLQLWPLPNSTRQKEGENGAAVAIDCT
jgi:hypothetical protein